MRYGWAIVISALTLSGCNAGPGKAQTADDTRSNAPPASASLPAPTSSEQCDAASLAYLVGRPRTEIPVPVDPSHRRVSCTSCVVTDDYRPDKQALGLLICLVSAVIMGAAILYGIWSLWSQQP